MSRPNPFVFSRSVPAVAAAVAALLLVSTPAVAVAAPHDADGGPRQRVLVQLRSAADAAPLADAQRHAGGRIRHLYAKAVAGFSADLPAGAVRALERNPAVVSVTAVPAARISDTQASPGWDLDRVDQHPRSLSGGYSYDTTGLGVTAYVVDTGILTSHSQFGGRASSGYDFVDMDSNATDCNGHGTHVAGTIGGSTYGVAKAVKLVGVRVLDCDGSGYLDDVLAGLDWVAQNAHKPAVVNMSLGGDQYQPLDDAVARLTAAGVPVVVAAGNDDLDACGSSPAAAPSALTVGATDSTDTRAWFSNTGSCVDLFAPGVDVKSSWIGSSTATNTISGTSMAAPHVTGAVARYLQGRPGATVGQVASALLASATGGAVADAESAHSGLLYLAPATVRLPDAPASVTARQTGVGSATITWSPAANTGSALVTGYRVSRDGTDSHGGGPATTAVSATTRSYTFGSLVPGRTYNLWVRAVTAAGTGYPVTAAVPVSSGSAFNAPSAVSAVESASGAVRLSWQPPTVLAGRTVTGYRLTRVATSTSGAFATTVASTARAYTFPGLAIGAKFDLTIQAVTTAGTGPVAKGTVPVYPYVSAPSSVTATQPSAGSLKLSWQPPATLSGQAVTGYRVVRDGTDASGRGPVSTVVSASARSLVLGNLVAGRAYTLTVQAETAVTLGVPQSVRLTVSA